MNLSDALSEWPGGNQSQSSSGGSWPGQQPNNPLWPGVSQPSAPGMWSGPSPQPTPSFPGGPSPQPTPSWGGPTPSWPGGPSGPTPSWPGGPAQPVPSWPGAPSQPSPSSGFAPLQNLSVPFKQDFPDGLQDKSLITICGTVKPNPNKFTIDFCSASDLVFHLNPRFNEGGNKVIVRNSQIGKRWGQEERDHPHFPFVPGQQFEIKILVTNSCFSVTVNNRYLFDFKHRMLNLRAINCMNIYYDVTLSKVTVGNN